MGAVGQLNAMLNLKGLGIDDIDGLLVFVGKNKKRRRRGLWHRGCGADSGCNLPVP